MSDMSASVTPTTKGFSVTGYEKIEYDFEFLDGVFNPANAQLAKCYERWQRCLVVMDMNMYTLYGKDIESYFAHYNIPLMVHQTMVGEKAKTTDSMLAIVDSMTTFGIYRKEPVLVVGGGLVTDVAGFACAAYRRTTNYIRVPTTVIGLIDASVSIKVAVNYGQYKNRLGAYHAPMHTFLDFTFLRTLPLAQIRNGFAELIKISSCAHSETFHLLDKYCEQLIGTAFGRVEGTTEEVREAADKICRAGIYEMLKLETPNLHEIMLDRVIAYGHTWSPLHELVPDPPLRHGHAISIDMAFSATLAHSRGILSDEDHMRLLSLFSRANLSMDHVDFNEEVLEKATAAILKTRDGKLRAAVPVSPMGTCVFLNDVGHDEMCQALRAHKEICKQFPRNGEGLDAYVDVSDTGRTVLSANGEEMVSIGINGKVGTANGNYSTQTNGHATKGVNGKAQVPRGLAEKADDIVVTEVKDVINGQNGHAPEVAVANGSAA